MKLSRTEYSLPSSSLDTSAAILRDGVEFFCVTDAIKLNFAIQAILK